MTAKAVTGLDRMGRAQLAIGGPHRLVRHPLYAAEAALLGAVFPDYACYARRTARLIPGVW